MEEYPKMYLYRRIVQAKLFIDQHYEDNIPVENIADEAFFSKFHFIRLFKQAYGKTPHQYLTSVRIEKARLLLKSETTVAAVCGAVGFESISSFTGLFKKIVGVSPARFQLEHSRRKADILQRPLNYIPGCFVEKALNDKS